MTLAAYWQFLHRLEEGYNNSATKLRERNCAPYPKYAGEMQRLARNVRQAISIVERERTI